MPKDKDKEICQNVLAEILSDLSPKEREFLGIGDLRTEIVDVVEVEVIDDEDSANEPSSVAELPKIVGLVVCTKDDLGSQIYIVDREQIPDLDLKAAVECALQYDYSVHGVDGNNHAFGEFGVQQQAIFHDLGYFLDQMEEQNPGLFLKLPQTIEAFVELIH